MKRQINGLLIAAGFSSRMHAFKPLLPWRGEPLVIAIARKMLTVCHNLVIVTGYRRKWLESVIKQRLADQRSRLILKENAHVERGMFSSLQIGINALDSHNWLLYHFVDQPAIPQPFYRRFVEQIEEKAQWIQPVYLKRKGHPVLLHPALQQKITAAPLTYTLRKVLAEAQVNRKIWPCSYPQVLWDVDQPEDYWLYARMSS